MTLQWGSGSLLLNAKKYSNETNTINYFGQELNTTTYNLARMNMILHSLSVENQHLRNADTLYNDWPIYEPTNFDMVLMNPLILPNGQLIKAFRRSKIFRIWSSSSKIYCRFRLSSTWILPSKE